MPTLLHNHRALRNRYFGLRHGESFPMREGVIVSDPTRGQMARWSLTLEGERSVIRTARTVKRLQLLTREVVVLTSPFSRTVRTAEVFSSTFGCAPPIIVPELRERWFGFWNGTVDASYAKVWERDKAVSSHTERGVESTELVLARMSACVRSCEYYYAKKDIVLVSHGDPLNILGCEFRDESPKYHRFRSPLKPADFRSFPFR